MTSTQASRACRYFCQRGGAWSAVVLLGHVPHVPCLLERGLGVAERVEGGAVGRGHARGPGLLQDGDGQERAVGVEQVEPVAVQVAVAPHAWLLTAAASSGVRANTTAAAVTWGLISA